MPDLNPIFNALRGADIIELAILAAVYGVSLWDVSEAYSQWNVRQIQNYRETHHG